MSGSVEDFKINFIAQDYEPFVSYEGLEQLHRFIFVMAITHISYSCLTMLLAIVKVTLFIVVILTYLICLLIMIWIFYWWKTSIIFSKRKTVLPLSCKECQNWCFHRNLEVINSQEGSLGRISSITVKILQHNICTCTYSWPNKKVPFDF